MKRIGLLVLGLCSFVWASAQVNDGFDDFMQQELNEFDEFISKENQEFIEFLRDPWKEENAEKPIPLRPKPEPIEPIVYDEKENPVGIHPTEFTIEAIFDQSTADGSQRAVTQVNDVDNITFEEQPVIVKKKKSPTVITVVEREVPTRPIAKETKPVERPVTKPTPQPTPTPAPKAEPKPEATESPKPTPAPTEETKTVERVKPVEETRPVVVPQPVSKPTPAPRPSSPLTTDGENKFKLAFGGTTFYLPRLDKSVQLKGLTENDVANTYEALCGSNYNTLLNQCQQIRKELKLNDWGYYTLIKEVSNKLCSNANESAMLQFFLLNQAGYQTKVARKGDNSKLLLFINPDTKLYGLPFLNNNGKQYYMVNENQPCQFYMPQKEYANAQKVMGMHINTQPTFYGDNATSTHQAKGSSARVTASVPKELMNFYKSYPQCDFSVYLNAPVHPDVEATILSSLAPLVQGKSEKDAANLLINFVQTGFDYKTDPEQFGYEKPFFVEELFYYPYSDCEDRAILYSFLVKKLLGLDVVLLDYPEHIATAVKFNENIAGDFVMVGNQKYIICDPTYVGAPIGAAMPVFKNTAAKVLKY